MKVLHINAVYGIGSTGVIAKDLKTLCNKNGIESHVAFAELPASKNADSGDIHIGNRIDHKMHAMLSRIGGKQGYFSRIATRILIKKLRFLKPDVVHLHNIHANYINLELLFSYLNKYDIPTVITLHDCWIYTGGCFHYIDASCEKWKDHCSNCPKRFSGTPAYLYDSSSSILEDRKRWLLPMSRLHFVGVSKWVSEECKQSLFRAKDILTIYNGIDTEVFKPTLYDIKNQLGLQDKFVILGPATKWLDVKKKGNLNKLSSLLKPNMVFVLFGCSNTELSLPENVIAYGFTSNQVELAKLYSAADVFVNSTHADSLSLINLEAQSCGTPVITFANTGAKETVDGICSFAVKNDNIDEMFEKIELIEQNGKTSFSASCRQRIQDKFDKNKNYLKYLELYKSIAHSE